MVAKNDEDKEAMMEKMLDETKKVSQKNQLIIF